MRAAFALLEQPNWLTSSTDVAAKRLELSRARMMARAWAEEIPASIRPDVAARFVRRAFEALGSIRAPNFKLSASNLIAREQLDDTALWLARSMGHAAASIPLLEGCHFLSSLYTTLLPAALRSSLGAFHTPPVLAKRLLDLASSGGLDWRTARILDPASGGGVFLLEAACRIRENLQGSNAAFILAQLETRLAGFEFDPHIASLSQTALEIALADLSQASGRPVPTFVKVGDTLEAEASPIYDLVVGNPPYGRTQLTAAQRARYKRSLYGHANLYGIFTDAALRWARDGGMIAFLTPTSVLGGQYFMALRKVLAAEAPPIAVDFVHARKGVFEDVLQETLLAVYRRGARSTRFQVHYLQFENETQLILTKNGKVSLPKDPSRPWLAPRNPEHSRLISASEKMEARFADWGYEISTGPLVWNRHKSQLCQHQGPGVFPLIWAEAVTADGRFVFRAEKRNHLPFFHLQKGDEWLVVSEGCVLVQRTTAKEQHRRLIAAELPAKFVRSHSGVVIENHLNMVRAVGNPKVSPTAVAALLNSDIADQMFRCISGSVAVSAFELEALPLPSPDSMVGIENLVKKGGDRATIQARLRKLYGI